MHVIVNVGQAPVPISAGGQRVQLAAGERLLLAGLPLPRGTGLQAVALAGSGMARALAHYDHASGVQRPVAEPPPLCWAVPAALDVPDVAAAWLIGQLARGAGQDEDPPAACLLRHLARSESYGLMRFLLEEGGESTVAALAERYGLSSAQFHRRCRQVLGRPLKRELRIQRAARALLAYPGRARSFTYLAADHGYASLSHFCTDVKSLIGCSPLSVYRAVPTPNE
ncbi:helix-turn-helix domain-containing protein [Stenotrophomonas aracearum]|jgi:AraC-like DNA-binding protein|uniref:Helix-turn-helix domain-containing protein n=1 Tax=Stenotrophomonas aracearum TaxID=3003272 RepID=A0ABY9YA28_9GAMM|nr:helix-turn-helix domain-containing protein [Stenotrophomonas sp. A5588]WNH47728.1 helix-turn-helix domain-containing protein [Stenotrophomonas sp. A5588]